VTRLKQLTFYAWLMEHVDQDTAIGDLARDARADEWFPTNRSMIAAHLRDSDASEACILTYQAASRRWRADQDQALRDANERQAERWGLA
jgi:YozE SAM-like fold